MSVLQKRRANERTMTRVSIARADGRRTTHVRSGSRDGAKLKLDFERELVCLRRGEMLQPLPERSITGANCWIFQSIQREVISIRFVAV